MAIALLLFVALLIVGRLELGIKGIAISIAMLLALVIAIEAFGLPPALFSTGTALFDIGLILFIFGADIPLRPKS
jgi:hypothetical protein